MNPKLHLKSQIVDTQSGEIICGCGCGLVITEKTVDNRLSISTDEKVTIHFKFENNFEHDKGLGTAISNVYFQRSQITAKQKSQHERLRKWNDYTRIDSASNRRLAGYFNNLNFFKTELNLSPTLQNEVISFLRRLEKKHALDGKLMTLVFLAVTHLVKKLHGIPFNTKQYRKKYHYKISTYLRYVDEFKTALEIKNDDLPTPRLAVMMSICDKLNIKPKTMNSAMSIVDYCIDKGMFVSKQPSILAATCLYVVSMNNNEKVFLIDFADAASCTTVSIASLKKEMKEVFELFNLKATLTQAITGLRKQERHI